MATRIDVKRGDTEVSLKVNMNLTGATAIVWIQNSVGVTSPLTSTIEDVAKGGIVADVSDLDVGSYKLEVEVTQGGVVSTFPNVGYAILKVSQDLG